MPPHERDRPAAVARPEIGVAFSRQEAGRAEYLMIAARLTPQRLGPSSTGSADLAMRN
jgi:hypothetical protein